jgi:suppressor of fused-like protein
MSDSPGWEAIEAKLASIYGDQTPKHWGTVMRYSAGGPDPLDGVSAYKVEAPSHPHWLYVSFGFSELYAKKSSNAEESGWGFELIFRLERESDETEPPLWPVMMLQNLARYVFKSNSPFDDEHYIAWGRPITSHEETQLEATVFRNDPVLGQIDTPNGKLKFLSAIAITKDEHDLVASQGADKLFPLLLQGNPLGVVDIDRSSLLGA